MSLVFIEGFDAISLSDLDKKWSGINTIDNFLIDSTNPRFNSGNNLRIDRASRNIFLNVTSKATYIIGFAFRRELSFDADVKIVAFQDVSTHQISIQLNVDGTFSIIRGTSTVLSSSVNSIDNNIWYYIEFKATINNTTGSYELRVDESIWDSDTNVDTQETANASADTIVVGTFGTSTAFNRYHRFDDIYICDTDGTDNNDFLGDVRVETILPSGNGTSSDFTGSDGNSIDNYLLVDDAVADDDSTYVESSGVGHTDLYLYDNLTSEPISIFGVQINTFARRTDTEGKTVIPMLRTGGTNFEGTGFVPNTNYDKIKQQIYELNPDTSVAWTKAEINEAEFGIRVGSG